FHKMFEVVRRLAVRVARSRMIERASSSAKLCATKLYCPPTPLTTWPFSSASEIAAPSKVAIMALLTKRLHARAALAGLVAVELVHERDRAHAQLGELGRRHFPQRAVEGARA